MQRNLFVITKHSHCCIKTCKGNEPGRGAIAMRGKLLWSCRDVGTFSSCSDLCPWDAAMCVAVVPGKSQLLQQSSKLQSSGGIVIGNNWEWVDFEWSTATPGIIARHVANNEVWRVYSLTLALSQAIGEVTKCPLFVFCFLQMFLKSFRLRHSHLQTCWMKSVFSCARSPNLGRQMPDKKRKCFASTWLHFHNIYLGKWHTELKLTLPWLLHVHHSPVKSSCSSAYIPNASRSSNTSYVSLGLGECSLMLCDMASAGRLQRPSLFGWGVSKSDLINYHKKKDDWTKIGSI